MNNQKFSLKEKRDYEYYMNICLSLATRGTGFVSPNPLVGALVVDEEKRRILSYGYHRRYGGEHAEAEAIKSLGVAAKGKTLIVNLEPCSHWGKTPPCVNLIISAGISKVVIGTKDPNPNVRGKGINILKKSGIKVISGILKEKCIEVNDGFFSRFTIKRPAVWLKFASFLDGKIALPDGTSKWISNIYSRSYAHTLRSVCDAILVGINTIIKDDPLLNTRLVDGPSPIPVILDPKLRIPLSSKVLNHKPIIYYTASLNHSKVKALKQKKAKLIKADSDKNGYIRLDFVLENLLEHNINRVLVEGGSKIISSFIRKNLFDKMFIFVAPKILGKGLSFSEGIITDNIENAFKVKIKKISKIKGDLLIEACSLDWFKRLEKFCI